VQKPEVKMTPDFSDPGWMVQVNELSDHVTVLNHWKASAVLTLERIKNADLDLPGYFFVPGLASVKKCSRKTNKHMKYSS
jgi:hypothetical protein